mgnify:FL=1
MLTIYDKMSISPHKSLSEYELSFLLEYKENIYDHFIKINENDKINSEWLEDDYELITETDDLFLEATKQFGIKNLISKIQNVNFNDKISFDEIILYLKNSKLSKCIDKCAKRYSIIIFPINFSNPTQINWIKKQYNLNTGIERDNLSLKEYQEKEIETFKMHLENSLGAIIFINGFALMFLNTQHGISKQTVIHELYHYLQEIFNFDKVLSSYNKFIAIPELLLSKEQVKYLLSENEFLPHINELAEVLTKIYFKYFKDNMSKNEFLDKFIKLVSENFHNILKTNLAKIYRKENKNDVNSFVILPACKFLNEDYLFKIGLKSLEKEFIYKTYFYQEKGN